MGKQIATWSYWLGAVCAVLAVVTRVSDVLGRPLALATKGGSISYHTFLNGALLLFVISIATTSYSKASAPNR